MRGLNTVLFCFVSKFRAAFLRNRMGNEREGRKSLIKSFKSVEETSYTEISIRDFKE